MSDVIAKVGDGFSNAFLMAYEVWWALVLGFAISGIVQAWIPRRRIEATLSGKGVQPIGLATGLGAASSSCSYAAIAIAKSLFQKEPRRLRRSPSSSLRPTSCGSSDSFSGS